MLKKISILLLLSLFSTQSLGVTYHFERIQDAVDTPFDNTSNGFISTDTQSAIEEIANSVAVSASPGFTWGDSGNISNSYLLNDSVPSNRAGRLVPVTTGELTTIFVTAENTSTAIVEVQKRVGAAFITIASIDMAGTRKNAILVPVPPALVLGDELAVYVTGAIKNPVVGIIIKGSL